MNFARARLVLIFLFIMSWTPLGSAKEIYVRRSEQDGINAAWLFLAVSGREVDYRALEKAHPPLANEATLKTVGDACASEGLRSRLVRLSFQELTAARLPAVVLLRPGADEAAHFAIVVEAIPGAVAVIHTGLLIPEQMTEDEFRRNWTGHALLATDPATLPGLALITVGAGLAVPFVRWVARRPGRRGGGAGDCPKDTSS